MCGEQSLLHSELKQRVEESYHFFPLQKIKTLFINFFYTASLSVIPDGQVWTESCGSLMFLQICCELNDNWYIGLLKLKEK